MAAVTGMDTLAAFSCGGCPPGGQPLRLGFNCSQSPGLPHCDKCPGKTWVFCSRPKAAPNRTVSRGCRAGCKVKWLHVPKCGSAFWLVVGRYACGAEGNAATGLDGACPLRWKTAGHEPLNPQYWGHAVGNFRHPRARMASFCRRHGDHSLRDRSAMLGCLAKTVTNRHMGIMVKLLVSRLPAARPTIP